MLMQSAPVVHQDRVVGLYSFPKSGNTWLRAIIAAIVGVPDAPGALQKYLTDSHFGKVMENPVRYEDRNWYFYKSHHKDLLRAHMGDEITTDRVVYIYRHPLDVFVSYLNFVSRNVSPRAGRGLPFQFDSVEALTPGQMEQLFDLFLTHGTLFPKNRAFGGIFEHIENFQTLARGGQPVHILRYEDLLADFIPTARKMAVFLGLRGVNLNRVFQSADQRTAQDGKFFWKRTTGNYRAYLTEDQIARFHDAHGTRLTRLGY